MTITRRLRNLDSKAGFYKQATPEQWKRMAWAWRGMLANACFLAALVVGFRALPAQGAGGMSFMAFVTVFVAFRAGQMKVEDDRLRGVVDRVAGHRGPDGM